MEALEAIFARRSIRAYTDRPIGDADLSEILAAGLMAPSATNLQPWYFAVIRSWAQMERLMEIMGTVSDRLEPGLRERFAAHPEVAAETARFIRQLGGAPVCILAFRRKHDYANDTSIVQSVAAALENMLIAAAGKGVGSCWLTAPQEAGMSDALREAFAPGKGALVAIATLGYPAKVPQAPKRKEGRFTIL